MARKPLTQRKWFYILVYLLFVVIAFLPLYTEHPYDPRDTQQVIFEILKRTALPHAAWGWVFHVLTLTVVGLAVWKPQVGGRAIAAYFGLNYLVIAAVQTHAEIPTYGLAVHTGALVADLLLGLLWLWVAWKDRLQVSLRDAPRWRWVLFPLALLAFWTPVAVDGTRFVPNFDPLLLLTSPDYGLAYCLLTPVFLFLLVLAYPKVDRLALHVTAFNGLLYGLFNLSLWSNPDTRWMGVMHLPLLVLSLVAVVLAWRMPEGTLPE